ncbi:helix-turn-helix domain-containing protein [Nocardiopsis mangrovi]|uniref:Helix-turn-helix domain-containing protein n=1 Tax=Nocardiopsis mangrovi TaxID=1179818 RepID=A0ABV9E6K8_9ACTN
MLKRRPIGVAPELRPWISEITALHADADTVVVDEPDHATTLTLRSAPGESPRLVVMGPRTRALYFTGAPGPSCLKVRVRPGRARRLLGRSLRGLVDQVVPLSELWGSADPLAGLPADPDAFARALVAAARGGPDVRGDLVGEAAGMVSAAGVRTSADRLHISERHLRTLFADGVGVAPKRFARIDRVRTVLEHGTTRPWSELALAAGYADHSHMTAEFRSLMGVPPTVFFAGGVSPDVHCGTS